jgi:hypothetical protein
VQHDLHALAGPPAGGQVAGIALDEGEALPGALRDALPYVLQVPGLAGGEVVQAHHRLVQLQQLLEDGGADEAGHAGHEPALGAGVEILAEGLVEAHHRLQ